MKVTAYPIHNSAQLNNHSYFATFKTKTTSYFKRQSRVDEGRSENEVQTVRKERRENPSDVLLRTNACTFIKNFVEVLT